MAPKKKRPGERRRHKRTRSKRKSKPSFARPLEWAEQELIGVQDWLKRLRGPEKEVFPKGWRLGQIRHYTMRARALKLEIQALKNVIKATEPDPDEPSNVA